MSTENAALLFISVDVCAKNVIRFRFAGDSDLDPSLSPRKPADETIKKSITVAYDLSSNTNESLFNELRNIKPNHLLWSHSLCWTEGLDITPDFVTFLYQFNAAPWFDTQVGVEGAADLVLQQESADDLDMSDLEQIKIIAELLRPSLTSQEEQPQISLQRLFFRRGSPVRSNRIRIHP